jgi:predicted enzyme related to lactoylglutathione lyase
MLRRRASRPSVRVQVCDVEAVTRFYADIGWTVDDDVVRTPGGSFTVFGVDAPPRLELALSVEDPIVVEALAELVEPAGGLIMEPLQETGYGGFGFSFNDPEGSCWEIGAPWTVTAGDLALRGIRPDRRGPIVMTPSLTRGLP